MSLFSFRKSSPAERDELKELGLNIIKDRKLDDRITDLKEFNILLKRMKQPKGKTYEEKLQWLMDQVDAINEMLSEISIPWGRAANEQAYAKAMGGWSGLHSLTLDAGNSFLRLMERSEQAQPKKEITSRSETQFAQRENRQKRELFDKYQSFVTRYYVRYAMLVAAISWRSQDVAPSYSVVIQQQMMPGYGGGGPAVPMTGLTSQIEQPPSAQVPRLPKPAKGKRFVNNDV